MEETSVFENFELQLDQTIKKFLRETAKWAYLLSFLGFIAITVLLIFGIFGDAIFLATRTVLPGTGEMFDSYGSALSTFYLIGAAICFLPTYYLFRFALKTKTAFKNNDSEALKVSFGYLKSHYKFIAIFTLFIFILYGISIGLMIFNYLLAR
jgi:hypothetical protein